MKFLISLFKAAPKGDNFRPVDKPVQYANQIARLNALGDNQYKRLRNSVSNAAALASSTR